MIERSETGDIAVLRIEHGPVNAMDLELVTGIARTFTDLAADPPSGVVLTGTGKAFSAGVDLRRYLDGGEEYIRSFLPALTDAFEAVFTLNRPVVAAVNGHAIAGGCVLACCADLRLMAEGRGRIGVPEAKVGVAFPRTALDVLTHAVGVSTASHLVYGAQTYLPAAAAELGLVDAVVPADELVDHAVEAATEWTNGIPSDTFALTKAQLRRDTVERYRRYREDTDAEVERIWVRRARDGWVARYLEAATGKG